MRSREGGERCGQRFFVKKAEVLDWQVRRGMIEKSSLSVGAQFRLLSITRSTIYFELPFSVS
jgi:hypothetical protein